MSCDLCVFALTRHSVALLNRICFLKDRVLDSTEKSAFPSDAKYERQRDLSIIE